MAIEAKIIADSISETGKRITTMQLKFHRFILPEFNTHRMFSRNASSSRAIPVSKIIEQVKNDPAVPVYWGKNISGMQAKEELTGKEKNNAIASWYQARDAAVYVAEQMMNNGVHKQITNRLLETWQWSNVVVTATEWDNFFMLRDHPAAQPEIQELARKMKAAMDASDPKLLSVGEWHLPYVSDSEVLKFKCGGTFNDAIKCSAARCARVSYLTHDGKEPNIEQDLELFNMLVTRPFTDKRGNVLTEDDPIHASPIEHQASPNLDRGLWSGNFQGWIQYRKVFENKLKGEYND